MGGTGSGDWYRWDKQSTVEECRSIDIRRWQRDGLLAPGRWFDWSWMRDGKTVASINVRVEAHRVILSYRHRSRDEEWRDEEYPLRLDRTRRM